MKMDKKLISSKFDFLVFEFWFICFTVRQIHLYHFWDCIFESNKKMFNSSNDRRNNKEAENKFEKKQFKNLIFLFTFDGVIFCLMAKHSGYKRHCEPKSLSRYLLTRTAEYMDCHFSSKYPFFNAHRLLNLSSSPGRSSLSASIYSFVVSFNQTQDNQFPIWS